MEEIENLTFQPRTNSTSTQRRGHKTEDMLIGYGLARKRKIESLQKQKSIEESSQFDFHPKILKSSEAICRRKEKKMFSSSSMSA